LLLSLALIRAPFQFIRSSFIELGGGILQDKEATAQIEKVIANNLPSAFEDSTSYITKMGSSYLVVIYIAVKGDYVDVGQVEAARVDIFNALVPEFHTVEVEIMFRR